jgi:succinoglycan biosynthesis protein ExoW
VTEITVVIPYYQTKPGILRTALASVLAQNLQKGWKLDVVVVDDCSPSPAELELGNASRVDVSIRVIKRPNGGPAAARNTGLDAGCRRAEYIAFLDSDDRWAPDHLNRAITTLGADGDFYFSDQRLGNLSAYLTRFQELCAEYESPEFERSGLPVSIVARDAANPAIYCSGPDGSYTFANREEGLTALLRCFLPHMSSSVIRASKLGHLRFRSDLRSAGEDYLYFLMLANSARKMCYSRHVGVARGRGISMYHNAVAWDDPHSLDIAIDNSRSLLLAKANLSCSGVQGRILNQRISFRRLELTARAISEFKKGRLFSAKSLWRIVWTDPALPALFPLLCFQALVRRIRRKPITDYLRVRELP